MARTLDFLALSAILIVLSFVFGVLIFQNVWLALVVSIAFSLAIMFSISFFGKKKHKTNPSLYATYFAIKGNDFVINILKNTLKNSDCQIVSNTILLEKCAIFVCFKFSAVSNGDIASLAKAIENTDVKQVFILANGIDRKAYQVANFLGIRLKLVHTSTLCRYLEKHNALPNLKKPKNKISFQIIFEMIFAKNNFKAYAFSGAVLLITSFLTPLKIYYLVCGSICLMLALFSLVFGNGNLSTSNPFKQFESAADKDCASKEKSDD